MKHIQRFEIIGLFGDRDISIAPARDAMILVGPNGIGKSSVVNILYFFITRQWSRLLAYKFDSIKIQVDRKEISAERSDISGLSDFRQFITDRPVNSRIKSLIDSLDTHNLLEDFAY